jgi:hypothetical protein
MKRTRRADREDGRVAAPPALVITIGSDLLVVGHSRSRRSPARGSYLLRPRHGMIFTPRVAVHPRPLPFAGVRPGAPTCAAVACGRTRTGEGPTTQSAGSELKQPRSTTGMGRVSGPARLALPGCAAAPAADRTVITWGELGYGLLSGIRWSVGDPRPGNWAYQDQSGSGDRAGRGRFMGRPLQGGFLYCLAAGGAVAARDSNGPERSGACMVGAGLFSRSCG